MWKKYFKLVKVKPGKIVTQQFGVLDFSTNNLNVDHLKILFENDFRYLEITEEGKKVLYGIDAVDDMLPIPLPEIVTEIILPSVVEPVLMQEPDQQKPEAEPISKKRKNKRSSQ